MKNKRFVLLKRKNKNAYWLTCINNFKTYLNYIPSQYNYKQDICVDCGCLLAQLRKVCVNSEIKSNNYNFKCMSIEKARHGVLTLFKEENKED